MKFSYAPYNNVFFATTLRINNNKDRLKWDTGNGGITLMLQGRFGEDIVPEIEGICKKLSEMDNTVKENFVSLAPEYPFVSARLIDAQQKARQGGCVVKGEVCRYTALACKVTGEECIIFEPKRRYTVDIPAEISVTYAKVYDRIESRVFRRAREEFAGFYEVAFENGALSAYKDGDIYYTINDINIPITNEMIKADCFYIKAEEMPSLKTKSDGFSISMREIQ